MNLNRLCQSNLALGLCVLGILFLSQALGLPASAQAAPNKKAKETSLSADFESLNSRYITLRNRDATGEFQAQWEDIALGFASFGENGSPDDLRARAFLAAANAYDFLDQRHPKSSYGESAVKILRQARRELPDSSLADDFLLKEAEIVERSDEDEAEDLYRKIVAEYPKSDMAAAARQRLGISRVKDDASESSPVKAGTKVVVIDPGHGGEDFGAVGLGGILEKDVTLAVALELEQILSKDRGLTVRLTRRKDVFVPLAERTAIANDFDAAIFVSLHTNASPESKLSGLETYYLDNSGDKASKKLAERENSSTRFEEADGDLQFMLSDLIQDGKLDDSIRLAKVIQGKLYNEAAEVMGQDAQDLGLKKGPFYVLVGAHMPCVLTEMFFIDHQVDGLHLADKGFRRRLAQGLASGIQHFLSGGA